MLTYASGLPPPPRYPIHQLQVGADGKPVSFMETQNKVEFPEEELVVGEGTYVLRDSLLIATPPPHPSEPPVFNPNPLATNPAPPTAGCKIYITQISSKPQSRPQLSRLASAFTPGRKIEQIIETERESRPSEDTGTGTSDSGSHPYSNGRTPVYGAGNAALTNGQSKDKDKRKKPKTALGKTSSAFISRFIPKDDLQKRIDARNGEYLALFASINRSFVWLDATEAIKEKMHNWTKIMFAKAHPLCHDLNEVTKSPSHIDIMMGTNLGDILWWEPISQRYTRINKNGAINSTPVTHIKWIPGSENLFVAAHLDGTLVVYDKERDDAPFQPESELESSTLETPAEEKPGMDFSDTTPVEPGPNPSVLQINKSVNSKNQKTNPVASYRVSNMRINAFAFSPDCRHLAVVTEDESLRIIDYLAETLLDLYPSYYEAFTCVCWSPDGRYVVTGGKDDLISVWSLEDRRIVCRCIGHKSWVSAVAFDPWRCDGRDYRFGSVGEDQRLLLWDFGPGMLHAPKGVRRGHTASVASLGAASTAARARAESLASLHLKSTTSLATNRTGPSGEPLEDRGFIQHPVESRKVVPELPPVLNKVIDDDPLSCILFREDCIITACSEGHVKTWDRPKDGGGLGIGQVGEVHRPETPREKEESHPFQRADGTVMA